VTLQRGRDSGGTGGKGTGRRRSNDSERLKVKSAFGLGFSKSRLWGSILVSSTFRQEFRSPAFFRCVRRRRSPHRRAPVRRRRPACTDRVRSRARTPRGPPPVDEPVIVESNDTRSSAASSRSTMSRHGARSRRPRDRRFPVRRRAPPRVRPPRADDPYHVRIRPLLDGSSTMADPISVEHDAAARRRLVDG
jgi:hypothetical protein